MEAPPDTLSITGMDGAEHGEGFVPLGGTSACLTSGPASTHLRCALEAPGDRGTRGVEAPYGGCVAGAGPSLRGWLGAIVRSRASSPWGLDPQCPTLDSLGHSV